MRTFFYTILIIATLSSCGGDGVIFPVSQDVKLGEQLDNEIRSKPNEYPIIPENQHPQLYAYLENMKKAILSSEDIQHRNDFAWKLTILDNDETLNAFATPGGYIYIYSGLIKYLDNPDDLAGVLGHEIAHADRRHSLKQMQKQYATGLLLQLALGDGGQDLARVASGLFNLSFSRSDESDADAHSVYYLEETDYACNGAASFFQKLQGESGARVPAFLSTHPNPKNRVERINQLAKTEQCNTNLHTEEAQQYKRLANTL